MTMEIRLKERLVGAMVLVLVAVIFIPMVLDGPNANRRISQSVALPDPAESDARRTVRLDLDAAASETPVESTAESSTGSTEPVAIDLVPSQEQTAARTPEANESPKPVTSKPEATASQPMASEDVADASWTVQAGSFSSDENAETLAAKLRKLGHPAYVSRYNDGKRTHYRVRVGGFPSRDAAQRKADEIRAETGEPATPVQAL